MQINSRSGVLVIVYRELRERLTSGVTFMLLTVEVIYINKLRKRAYGPKKWIAGNTVPS